MAHDNEALAPSWLRIVESTAEAQLLLLLGRPGSPEFLYLQGAPTRKC